MTKKTQTELQLPHGEAFKEAWGDWLQDRVDRKMPVTYNAAKRQLKLLASVTEQEAVLMIDNSINNNWRGIFKLKQWESPISKPNIYL